MRRRRDGGLQSGVRTGPQGRGCGDGRVRTGTAVLLSRDWLDKATQVEGTEPGKPHRRSLGERERRWG